MRTNMTNEEIITALVLNNPDLVEELVRTQLERQMGYIQKDMKNITNGIPVYALSLNPHEDYMLLAEQLKAFEIVLEYFTPIGGK
jgi:hypothetical protein